jgi:hypothetical protein
LSFGKSNANDFKTVDFGLLKLSGDSASLHFWGTGFAGLPAPMSDSTPVDLRPFAKKCPGILQVNDWLVRYRRALMDPKTKAEELNRFGEMLEQQMQKAARSVSVCRDTVLATYAIASVYLLTQGWKVRSDSKNPELQSTPQSAAWVHFTAAAIETGVLNFSDQIGSHDHQPRILGSYECGSTKLSVNPVQRPLNLGAAIIHEISHYFFDKFSWLNVLKEYRSDHFRELLLLEEAIASVHAGYVQRTFAQEVLAPHLKPDEIGDLALFADSGPIAQISKKLSKTPSGGNDFEEFVRAAFFVRVNFVSDDVEVIQGGAQALKTFREDLFNRISKVYFGRALTKQELKDLSPDGLNALFTTVPLGGGFSFEVSLDHYFTPYSKILFPLRWAPEKNLPYPKEDTHGWFVVSTTAGNLVLDFRAPYEMVATLINPELKEKQRLCRDFESWAQKQAPEQYVGILSDPNKPGVDGVRPGAPATRLGQAVRACVQIGDRL